MKAYQRQQQYVYYHYQLRHMTPGNALLISVCILMLPMVQLSAEHVQLATKYHANPINQWQVDLHRMNISHSPLVLSFLSNLLPAMILQNSVVRSCLLPTSSHFSVCYILDLSSGLGGRVVGVMFALLLLLSGDIETNPGPVGELPCCKGVYHNDRGERYHLQAIRFDTSTGNCMAFEYIMSIVLNL